MSSRPFLVLAILPALATGCAGAFEQPGIAAPHAVLAFPSQHQQAASSLFLEPVEFNGRQRPRDWMQEQFRVPAGELRLQLRAATHALQGACVLSLPVETGETYHIGAQFRAETFTLTATRRGETVGSCDSPATVLPTPARIPGVPAR
jgi:hypothetical protein